MEHRASRSPLQLAAVPEEFHGVSMDMHNYSSPMDGLVWRIPEVHPTGQRPNYTGVGQTLLKEVTDPAFSGSDWMYVGTRCFLLDAKNLEHLLKRWTHTHRLFEDDVFDTLTGSEQIPGVCSDSSYDCHGVWWSVSLRLSPRIL